MADGGGTGAGRALTDSVRQRDGSDLARLLAKLGEKKIAPVEGGKRMLAAVPPLGLLSGILEEIDETVMARCLILENAAGASAHLEVCNRRLLAATQDSPQSPGHAASLTYAGRAELTRLKEDLSAFCGDGPITIRTAPAAGTATLEQTGVAVAMLRQAWTSTSEQTATRASDVSLPLPDLIQAAKGNAHVLAWAAQLGEGRAAGGDEAAASTLSILLQSQVDSPVPFPSGARELLLLEAAGVDAPDGEAALAILKEGSDCAVLRLVPGSEAAFLALWSCEHPTHLDGPEE